MLPGCVCYSRPAQDRIAQWLIDDKQCRTDLAIKDDFIQKTMANIESPQTAWWQSPSVIVGGITVTAAVSTLLTLWIVRK